VLARGEGCYVFDTEGKRYLDLYAGIAVSSLGHAHPGLVAAVTEQVSRLIHTSNLFYSDKTAELAQKLCARSGMARVFFCNSGTEGIEGAIKLVRRFHYGKGSCERQHIVATWSAFHGRSMGAVSLTGQPKYWEGFGAPIAHVSHTKYGDLEAMARRLNDQTAAVFVEPIQGEGGVLPAPEGYLAGLRALCDKVGALLVLDEIQTGVGRTGRFLASEHDGVKADVVVLAKGLGGGVPIGAILVGEHCAGALPVGTHGTTFGGNPLAAAAALAVLRAYEEQDLAGNAARVGEHLLSKLRGLCEKYPAVAVAARGRGLMCGLELAADIDPRGVLGALRDKGVLLSTAGDRVLRFVPPLVVTSAQIDEGIAALDEVLSAAPRVVAPQK